MCVSDHASVLTSGENLNFVFVYNRANVEAIYDNGKDTYRDYNCQGPSSEAMRRTGVVRKNNAKQYKPRT